MKRMFGIFLAFLLLVMVLMLVLSVGWAFADTSSGFSKTYGGGSLDCAFSVIQTDDGGYALAGYTYSFGAGEHDFWLVRTDADGNMLWNQTYGGIDFDLAYCMFQTEDGGYALAGYTDSFGAGDSDFWLVKTDASGAVPEFPLNMVTAALMVTVTLIAVLMKKRLRASSART